MSVKCLSLYDSTLFKASTLLAWKLRLKSMGTLRGISGACKMSMTGSQSNCRNKTRGVGSAGSPKKTPSCKSLKLCTTQLVNCHWLTFYHFLQGEWDPKIQSFWTWCMRDPSRSPILTHVMRFGDTPVACKKAIMESCMSPQHGHKALHTTRCPFWMQFQHLSWVHWSRWKRKSSWWSPRQLILGQAPLVLFGHRRHPQHPHPIPPEDAPALFYSSWSMDCLGNSMQPVLCVTLSNRLLRVACEDAQTTETASRWHGIF